MLQKTVRLLLLSGSFSLPLASMAAQSTGYPRSATAAGDLVLVQSIGGTTDITGSGGYQQSTGGDQNPSDSSRDDPAPADPAVDAIGITPEATAKVVKSLGDGVTFCHAVTDLRLTVDCLSEQYDAAAKLMPVTEGYAKARKALERAAAKLHALAEAQADPGKPAVTARAGGHRSHRPLTPVADPAAANHAAMAIVQDTKLYLLRSANGSNQRRAAYEDVAAVVNSTKVILRAS